jgi:hypothetical protein
MPLAVITVVGAGTLILPGHYQCNASPRKTQLEAAIGKASAVKVGAFSFCPSLSLYCEDRADPSRKVALPRHVGIATKTGITFAATPRAKSREWAYQENLTSFDIEPGNGFGWGLSDDFQIGVVIAFAHTQNSNCRILLRQGYQKKFANRRLPDFRGALVDDDFPSGRH